MLHKIRYLLKKSFLDFDIYFTTLAPNILGPSTTGQKCVAI